MPAHGLQCVLPPAPPEPARTAQPPPPASAPRLVRAPPGCVLKSELMSAPSLRRSAPPCKPRLPLNQPDIVPSPWPWSARGPPYRSSAASRPRRGQQHDWPPAVPKLCRAVQPPPSPTVPMPAHGLQCVLPPAPPEPARTAQPPPPASAPRLVRAPPGCVLKSELMSAPSLRRSAPPCKPRLPLNQPDIVSPPWPRHAGGPPQRSSAASGPPRGRRAPRRARTAAPREPRTPPGAAPRCQSSRPWPWPAPAEPRPQLSPSRSELLRLQVSHPW